MLLAKATTFSGVVKCPPNTQAPLNSRQRSHPTKKMAARVLLILGLVFGVLALSDFAYNAYRKTACFSPAETDDLGLVSQGTRSDECQAEIASVWTNASSLTLPQ